MNSLHTLFIFIIWSLECHEKLIRQLANKVVSNFPLNALFWSPNVTFVQWNMVNNKTNNHHSKLPPLTNNISVFKLTFQQCYIRRQACLDRPENLSISWHGKLNANVPTSYNGRFKYVTTKTLSRDCMRTHRRSFFIALCLRLALIRRCCTLPINREIVPCPV